MLYVPGHSWNFTLSNVSGTRPASAWGATITPGTGGTKGSWAQIFTGAQVSTELFGILININNNSTAATTRNALVDIGIDPAGGTSYSVVIPDLIGGHAAPMTIGGIYYYFPLYIPAGSSVAVRAVGTVATTFNVALTVFGKPRRPDGVLAGTKVSAFGATLASATGTTVTAGTTAEGAWAQLGSTTTHPIWWWQCGMTAVDTTMTANIHTMDVATGDATNKDIVLQDALAIFTASEQNTMLPALIPGYDRTPSGVLVYGRVQCSGTADSALSMMAYGLG
jgi:hypothetical protein